MCLNIHSDLTLRNCVKMSEFVFAVMNEGHRISRTVTFAICSCVYILMEGETKRQTP